MVYSMGLQVFTDELVILAGSSRVEYSSYGAKLVHMNIEYYQQIGRWQM